MDGLKIRGLSLTRPWPYAFVARPIKHGVAPKRVENRSWPPSRWMIGHFLALHAAQSWDEEDREFIADVTGLYVPDRAESAHGEIFAVCRLAGFVEHGRDPRLTDSQRPWFFGPYGWLLDDFVPLREPVPCKGGRKLWGFESRPGVLAQLRASYGESREGLKLLRQETGARGARAL